jgi:hypothetical protein
MVAPSPGSLGMSTGRLKVVDPAEMTGVAATYLYKYGYMKAASPEMRMSFRSDFYNFFNFINIVQPFDERFDNA